MIFRLLMSAITYGLGYAAGSKAIQFKAGGKKKPAVVVNSDVARELLDDAAGDLVEWAETDGKAIVEDIDAYLAELLAQEAET